MVYIVRIPSNPPIRIVAGCMEPQLIISDALWEAGCPNTVEAEPKAPERSELERFVAEKIVNVVFKRMGEES